MSIESIPHELKAKPFWLLAGPDKNGKFKAPYTVNGMRPVLAKWKEEADTILMSFINAKIHATTFKYGMGLLLRESDGYTVIDFDIKNAINEPDIKKHTSPERLAVIKQMIDWLNSYTELSQSGTGYHVIVKGKIGQGIRHGDIEIYSQERFIVCTGNVYLDKPIADRQELLNELIEAMPRKKIEDGTELTELEPIETDNEIMESLWSASNAIKFKTMWQGHFGPEVTNQSLGLRPENHPEACFLDMSLVDHSVVQFLAWRTQSNSQVRRLFSMSPLSRREWQPDLKQNKHKHWHKDGSFNPRHVNMCLKSLRPILKKEQEKRQTDLANVQLEIQETKEILQAKMEMQLKTVSIDALDNAFKNGAIDTCSFVTPNIDWPPGLVGELAQFIYATSPKPVKEVAIVGALGLMGGICGRTFQLTSTGINVFLILVAKSGVGKEAMHSGISLILKQMEHIAPEIRNFVQYDQFASGQALMKSFASWPSFLHPFTEVSSLLEKISMSKLDAQANFFKTEILQLFNKSGILTKHGGAKHSDKLNNSAGVYGAAFTMIGDTQPTTFYNCLSQEMMSNGTLSRFVIIEHIGERMHTNDHVAEAIAVGLPESTKQKLKTVVEIAAAGVHEETCYSVIFSVEAKELIRRIDLLSDNIINCTYDETIRQRWNRFKEYVERISAILAASEAPTFPVVGVNHVEWAMNVMIRNVIMFDKRSRNGDIGNDDLAREEKGAQFLRDYLKENPGHTYGVEKEMYKQLVFPKRYFSSRAKSCQCFNNHRLGANVAVDITLKALQSFGDISPISELEAKEVFGSKAILYRINKEFCTHYK